MCIDAYMHAGIHTYLYVYRFIHMYRCTHMFCIESNLGVSEPFLLCSQDTRSASDKALDAIEAAGTSGHHLVS